MAFSKEDRKKVFDFFEKILLEIDKPIFYEYLRGHVTKASPVVKRYVLKECKGENLLKYFQTRKNYFFVDMRGEVSLKKSRCRLLSYKSETDEINRMEYDDENNEDIYSDENDEDIYNEEIDEKMLDDESEYSGYSRSNSVSSSIFTCKSLDGDASFYSETANEEEIQYKKVTVKHFCKFLMRNRKLNIDCIEIEDLPKKVKRYIKKYMQNKLFLFFKNNSKIFHLDDNRYVTLVSPFVEEESSMKKPQYVEDPTIMVEEVKESSFVVSEAEAQTVENFLSCVEFFVNVLKKKNSVPLKNLSGSLSQAPPSVLVYLKSNYETFRNFLLFVPNLFILNENEEVSLTKDCFKLLKRARKLSRLKSNVNFFSQPIENIIRALFQPEHLIKTNNSSLGDDRNSSVDDQQLELRVMCTSNEDVIQSTNDTDSEGLMSMLYKNLEKATDSDIENYLDVLFPPGNHIKTGKSRVEDKSNSFVDEQKLECPVLRISDEDGIQLTSCTTSECAKDRSLKKLKKALDSRNRFVDLPDDCRYHNETYVNDDIERMGLRSMGHIMMLEMRKAAAELATSQNRSIKAEVNDLEESGKKDNIQVLDEKSAASDNIERDRVGYKKLLEMSLKHFNDTERFVKPICDTETSVKPVCDTFLENYDEKSCISSTGIIEKQTYKDFIECAFTVQLLCLEIIEREKTMALNFEYGAVKYFVEILELNSSVLLEKSSDLSTLKGKVGQAPSGVKLFFKQLYKGEKIISFFQKNDEFDLDSKTLRVKLSPYYEKSLENRKTENEDFKRGKKIYEVHSLYDSHFYEVFAEIFDCLSKVSCFLQNKSITKFRRVCGIISKFSPMQQDFINSLKGSGVSEKLEKFLLHFNKLYHFDDKYVHINPDIDVNSLVNIMTDFSKKLKISNESKSPCFHHLLDYAKTCTIVTLDFEELKRSIIESVENFFSHTFCFNYSDLPNIIGHDVLLNLVVEDKDSQSLIKVLEDCDLFELKNGVVFKKKDVEKTGHFSDSGVSHDEVGNSDTEINVSDSAENFSYNKAAELFHKETESIDSVSSHDENVSLQHNDADGTESTCMSSCTHVESEHLLKEKEDTELVIKSAQSCNKTETAENSSFLSAEIENIHREESEEIKQVSQSALNITGSSHYLDSEDQEKVTYDPTKPLKDVAWGHDGASDISEQVSSDENKNDSINNIDISLNTKEDNVEQIEQPTNGSDSTDLQMSASVSKTHKTIVEDFQEKISGQTPSEEIDDRTFNILGVECTAESNKNRNIKHNQELGESDQVVSVIKSGSVSTLKGGSKTVFVENVSEIQENFNKSAKQSSLKSENRKDLVIKSSGHSNYDSNVIYENLLKNISYSGRDEPKINYENSCEYKVPQGMDAVKYLHFLSNVDLETEKNSDKVNSSKGDSIIKSYDTHSSANEKHFKLTKSAEKFNNIPKERISPCLIPENSTIMNAEQGHIKNNEIKEHSKLSLLSNQNASGDDENSKINFDKNNHPAPESLLQVSRNDKNEKELTKSYNDCDISENIHATERCKTVFYKGNGNAEDLPNFNDSAKNRKNACINQILKSKSISEIAQDSHIQKSFSSSDDKCSVKRKRRNDYKPKLSSSEKTAYDEFVLANNSSLNIDHLKSTSCDIVFENHSTENKKLKALSDSLPSLYKFPGSAKYKQEDENYDENDVSHKNSNSLSLQPFQSRIILLTMDSCIVETVIDGQKKNIFCLKSSFHCDEHSDCLNCFDSLVVGDSVLCYVPPGTDYKSGSMCFSFMFCKGVNVDKEKSEFPPKISSQKFHGSNKLKCTYGEESKPFSCVQKECPSSKHVHVESKIGECQTDFSAEIKPRYSMIEKECQVENATVSQSVQTVIFLEKKLLTVEKGCQIGILTAVQSTQTVCKSTVSESQTVYSGAVKPCSTTVEKSCQIKCSLVSVSTQAACERDENGNQTDISGDIKCSVLTSSSKCQTYLSGPVKRCVHLVNKSSQASVVSNLICQATQTVLQNDSVLESSIPQNSKGEQFHVDFRNASACNESELVQESSNLTCDTSCQTVSTGPIMIRRYYT